MNILLKSFLILCVVAASTSEEPPEETAAPETIPTDSTTPAPEETAAPETIPTDSTTPAPEETAAPETIPTDSTTPASEETTDVPSSTDPATETLTPDSTTTAFEETTDDPATERTLTPDSTTTAFEETTTGVSSSTNVTKTITTDFTTPAPEKTSSTAPATTTTLTTASTTQGPCALTPCIGDSTCEERFGGSFVCICRPGLVYNEIRGCVENKIFPGRLTLNKDFKVEMNDKTSVQFLEIADEVENALKDVLGGKGDGYIGSIVLSLSQGSIIAEVQNFFELASNVTSESIEKDITDGIKDYLITFQGFTRVSNCDSGYCDSTSTDCKDAGTGNATCTCKEGYISSPFTAQSCFSCPNGKRAKHGLCENCPFGFAGFNCSDPYLLVVVVVSSVLGALLIIFILALIVVSCRNQKESSSPVVDFSSNYSNKDLHKPTAVPRIPRANPDASWKTNSLEMTNSGSNQALVTRDRPQSKQNGFDQYEDLSYRSQGSPTPRYSNYDRRGVENGGVQNPYFRQDDDRMRRY